MLHYEEAIVRTYEREYKKKKVPFNQLNLGINSTFETGEKVGVLNILKLEDLIEKAKGTELKEMEAKYNELQEEKLQLEQELQEVKATNTSLATDVEYLKEEKIQLQEDLLKSEGKAEVKNEEIIQLQKEHKEELNEVNSDLKKATDKIEKLLILINNKDNDIVYLAKRGLGSRIRNKLTERIKATIIEVEAKNVEDSSYKEE